MTVLTKNLRIKGHVQGVGYRHWAATWARRNGLVGWVRNLTDGSVEALVQGPPDQVMTFITDCQTGPSSARVTAVIAEDAKPFEGTGFEQLPTAGVRN